MNNVKIIPAILTSLIVFINSLSSFSQGVSISGTSGAAPHASAILDLDVSALATKKGLLLPRMTIAQRSAISSPAIGLFIYQTDGNAGLHYYNGTEWLNPMGWGLKGNSATSTATNFLGTTDNVDMIFKTNSTERLRMLSSGQLLLTGGTSAGELRFGEPSASGSNYTAFKAQAQSADITYTLPATAGSSGQVLVNDGAGNLTWSTPSWGGTSVGSPSALVIPNGSTNNDLNPGSGNFIRLSGSSSNFDVTGIDGGVDGKILVIYNTGGGHMRLKNENAGSAAENRILTLKAGGGDASTNAQGAITLAYDGTAQRWIVISIND